MQENESKARLTQDSAIFSRLMDWEQNRVKAFDSTKRAAHLAALRNELESLKTEREAIVSKAANELKLWRYNADITQLNWRLKYLSNFETKSNPN